MTLFRYKKNGLLYTIQSEKRSSWTTAVLHATPYFHKTWIGFGITLNDFDAVAER